MFELEHAIADWRQKAAAAGINQPHVLDELESHLRADMERGRRSGLTQAEAFEVAVGSLGDPAALRQEFEKEAGSPQARVRRWRRAWLGVGALAYGAPLLLSAPHLWDQWSRGERWLGFGAIMVTLVSLFFGLRHNRFLPVVADHHERSRIQSAGLLVVIAWIGVFAYGILPRMEGSVGQLTIIALWAITPLAVLAGLVAGLDEAVERTHRSARS